MKIAVYPGSFDPFTIGHLDIALRAKEIFDKIVILVADNPKKDYLFNAQERLELTKAIFEGKEGFEVAYTDGIVVDEAKKRGSNILIRGIRDTKDFTAEYAYYEANRSLAPDVEMVYLMAHDDTVFISSSYVKELYRQGKDITKLVPEPVYLAIKNKLDNEK